MLNPLENIEEILLMKLLHGASLCSLIPNHSPFNDIKDWFQDVKLPESAKCKFKQCFFDESTGYENSIFQHNDDDL